MVSPKDNPTYSSRVDAKAHHQWRKKFAFRRKKEEQSDQVERASSIAEASPTDLDAASYDSRTPSRGPPSPLANPHAEPWDGDPYGLRVLHTPKGDPVADVILVHGLGGGSRVTWSKNRDLELFWPLKFLPYEPRINEARISTYGFDTSGASMSISDLARGLLVDLRHAVDYETREELGIGERPIVFIVHSFGGLIVKEAYIQGEHDPTYEHVVKAVSAIIFLATPHRGANFSQIIDRILQVSFRPGRIPTVVERGSDSQGLLKLNGAFRNIARKLEVVSFYETKTTLSGDRTEIMVLETASSTLGFAGEITMPLENADHHEVCKYTGPEDDHYHMVRDVLRHLVVKANRGPETKDTEHVVQIDYDEYLNVPGSWNQDYDFFRNRWTPGTCEWILEDKVFKEWIDDTNDRPRVLWVHGKAGCGKSILSSFLIEHITTQLKHPCQYFFVRFQDVKKRSLGHLIRILALQLAQKFPSYGEKLSQLQAATPDLSTVDARSLWNLLFKQAFLKLTAPVPIYWIIDGVDEAENPDSFIKLLQDVQKIDMPLRIAIISRKEHGLSNAFAKLSRLGIKTDSIFVEGRSADLQAYIAQELNIEQGDRYGVMVTQQLLERAMGSFLWLHLAVDKINSCHTKLAVSKALEDLPPGMEAFYDRMAASILAQTDDFDQRAGKEILGWVICAQRLLTIAELSDALETIEVLQIQSSIDSLCGGFVVIDKDGKAAVIHETAKEYLIRNVSDVNRLVVNEAATNNLLFRRCMSKLTGPNLRARIAKGVPPALLEYAASSWFTHLAQGSRTDPDLVKEVARFLRSHHVLVWIHVVAQGGKLSVLIQASRQLTALLSELEDSPTVLEAHDVKLIENWATDLVKVVGKFGANLLEDPESIYMKIPPFCPKTSAIYTRFGRQEMGLRVGSSAHNTWDDCLGRFSLDEGATASQILVTGSRVLIMANILSNGCVYVYDSTTLEEQRRITHSERLQMIHVSRLGHRLVGYGYKTTVVWELATGNVVLKATNMTQHARPHTLRFADEDNRVVVGTENRAVLSLSLEEEDPEWSLVMKIVEEPLNGYVVNMPWFSVLSPDGTMIAYAYRNYPITVWLIDSATRVGRCFMKPKDADKTKHTPTFPPEVFTLAWHPTTGEIFGLDMVGLLFKWNPHEEYISGSVSTGADTLVISQDGWLVGTGDAVGTIKVYTTADFALVYQLSSQDKILRLAFSRDSRRLYDIRTRGTYGNAWEPDALVKFAETFESLERSSSNSTTETATATKTVTESKTEFFLARVDPVIDVEVQPVGSLYSYGTEAGAIYLCDIGRGRIGEFERLARYTYLESMAWSEDGNLVALADLSGKIAIKRVARHPDKPGQWQINHEFEHVVPRRYGKQGHIRQVLFHPSSPKLFAYSSSTLFLMDLSGNMLAKSELPEERPGIKWIRHPLLPAYLLGFCSTRVHVIAWEDLSDIAIYVYEFAPGSAPLSDLTTGPASLDASADEDDAEDAPLHEQLKSAKNILRRVEFYPDLSEVVLAISHISENVAPVNIYLVLSVTKLGTPDIDDRAEDTTFPLECTVVPKEMAANIREPLSLTSSGDLIFLNHRGWICSWRLPSRGRKTAVSHLFKNLKDEINEHYFVPSDWVAGNEAILCRIAADGTLLCPRNGDVVTVQYSALAR